MKNPFEYLADLYDYHFQYARWFVHRRLLFSDLSVEKLKEQNIVNLFENKDNENVGMMIKSSTIYGLGAGLGIAPLTYVLNTDIYKKSPKSSIAPALGVVAVCTGIGLAYGSLVNGISQYRGGKNDFKNHAIAALLTFPVTGFYAKKNRMQYGILNSFVAAAFLSALKYSYSGNLDFPNPAHVKNTKVHSSPAFFKP